MTPPATMAAPPLARRGTVLQSSLLDEVGEWRTLTTVRIDDNEIKEAAEMRNSGS